MSNWFKKIANNGFKKIAINISIPPQYIYDVFAIGLITFPLNDLEKQTVEFRLHEIRDYISKVFMELMKQQVQKYLQRQRYDKTKEQQLLNPNPSAKQLAEMFNSYTFRSDMTRNNGNWGSIAMAIDKLQNSNSKDNIVAALAHQQGLFNLVHNTGTQVIDKFSNGYELVEAFEECHLSKRLRDTRAKCSKEIGAIVYKNTTYR